MLWHFEGTGKQVENLLLRINGHTGKRMNDLLLIDSIQIGPKGIWCVPCTIREVGWTNEPECCGQGQGHVVLCRSIEKIIAIL